MRNPADKPLWQDVERSEIARRIAQESDAKGKELPEAYKFSRSESSRIEIPRVTPTQTAEVLRLVRDACIDMLVFYEGRPPLSAEGRTVQLWTRSFFLMVDDRFSQIRAKIKPRKGQ